LLALAIAGAVSIGLALMGAYSLILNVGDWGWLIGASLGALIYLAAARVSGPASLAKAVPLAPSP
jgi:NCS1 family nucleobase:cation symporter-1